MWDIIFVVWSLNKYINSVSEYKINFLIYLFSFYLKNVTKICRFQDLISIAQKPYQFINKFILNSISAIHLQKLMKLLFCF